jgi:uncharacterized protein YqeY
MSLRDQINDDLKAAMRSGETVRRDTIRLLTAALKQREVDERKTLTDGDVLAVIEKMIKQRRDSISQFEQGGRQDLADKEKQELTLLQTYMPQAMGEDELAVAIAAAVSEYTFTSLTQPCNDHLRTYMGYPAIVDMKTNSTLLTLDDLVPHTRFIWISTELLLCQALCKLAIIQ